MIVAASTFSNNSLSKL